MTDSQSKMSLIVTSVHAMLYNNVDLLETFLTYKERCVHGSETLLLMKKWGDFLVRFSKQQEKPHLHFQLNALNLEIAVQARKEHNFQLASRHLEQNLGTNQDLMTYVSGINFNNTSMFLSTDKANCLRQSAKLGYVLQPINHEPGKFLIHKIQGVSSLIGVFENGLRVSND